MGSRWKRIGGIVIALCFVGVCVSGWWFAQSLSSTLQALTLPHEEHWKRTVQRAVDRHFGCLENGLVAKARIVSIKQKYLRIGDSALVERRLRKAADALKHMFFEIPNLLERHRIIENYKLQTPEGRLDMYTFYVVESSSKAVLVSVGIDNDYYIRYIAMKEGGREGLSGNTFMEIMYSKFGNYGGCLVPIEGSFSIFLPETSTKSVLVYQELLRFEYSDQRQN